MANTRRNLHQLVKGKQLYRGLYVVYTEVLHDLTAILKGETAKTTITVPQLIEEFREQRRRKLNPTDEPDIRERSLQQPP
jgi:predicted nucleic acid-binding protein